MSTKSLKNNSSISNNTKRSRLFDGTSYTQSIVTTNLSCHLDAGNNSSARENFLLYSEQLDNGNWAKENSVAVTANATTAPDGSNTADKVYELTNNGTHRWYQGYNAPGGFYTFSAYYKAAERNQILIVIQSVTGNQRGVFVNLANGTISSTFSAPTASSIESVGNGWYRVSITTTSDGSGNIFPISWILNSSQQTSYTGDGSSGIFMWGAQLEKGFAPRSYLQTTTSTFTKDTLWYDLVGSGRDATPFNSPHWTSEDGGSYSFRQGQGSGTTFQIPLNGFNFNNDFTIEFWFSPNIGSDWDWLLNVNDYTPGVNMTLNAGGTRISYGTWFTEAVTQTPVSGNKVYQYVLTRSGNSMYGYLNGVRVSGPINISSPGIPTTGNIRLGRGPSGGDLFWGRMSIFRLYSASLTDAQVLNNFNANRARFGL